MLTVTDSKSSGISTRRDGRDAIKAGVDELHHGLVAFPESGLKLQLVRGQVLFEGLDQLDLKDARYATILRLAASTRVVLVPTAIVTENTTLDRSPENRQFYTEAAWKALEAMEARKPPRIPEKLASAQKEFIRMAHAAGCLLGTGTDLVIPWMPPGVSLWREAEILAEAGLPPMDVLKVATWNGIYSIGATDQLGTIEPGKLADFVVLDANPLDDIRNLRHVHRVVKSGIVYDPRQILNRLRGRLN